MNTKIKSVVGSMCEINTMDNELLAIGKISRYIPEEKTIEIISCNGSDMPSAKYGTKVKINVFNNKSGYLGLDGFVYIAHTSFWRIYDVSIFGVNERRGYFRIKTHSQAEVEEIQGYDAGGDFIKGVKYPCMVTSTSISGVLVAVDNEQCCYNIGSTLLISNFTIGENSKIFSLKCCVRRIDHHEVLGKLFGCEFVDLDDKDMEKLCQAVFAQQRKEIQRRRGL